MGLHGEYWRSGDFRVITLVLAGFLGPRDFGIVSISLIYVNFMQMFLDQGLAPALIQKKELQQEHCECGFLGELDHESYVRGTHGVDQWMVGENQSCP